MDEETLLPLTGLDYITMSIKELAAHSEYSSHAHRVVSVICDMNTEQLEALEVSSVPKKR